MSSQGLRWHHLSKSSQSMEAQLICRSSRKTTSKRYLSCNIARRIPQEISMSTCLPIRILRSLGLFQTKIRISWWGKQLISSRCSLERRSIRLIQEDSPSSPKSLLDHRNQKKNMTINTRLGDLVTRLRLGLHQKWCPQIFPHQRGQATRVKRRLLVKNSQAQSLKIVSL